MAKLSLSMKFLFYILFLFTFSQNVFSDVCSWREFDEYELGTQLVYIAYYGRPGDPEGVRYWADRSEQEGGSLDSIIQEFGSSQEFNERFGHMNHEELVTNIYWQLFDRQPDEAGVAYYTDLLNRGAKSLQTITLDVLFGARGGDVDVLAYKLGVSATFVTHLENEGMNYHDLGLSILEGVVDDQTAENRCTTIVAEMIDEGNNDGSLANTVWWGCIKDEFFDKNYITDIGLCTTNSGGLYGLAFLDDGTFKLKVRNAQSFTVNDVPINTDEISNVEGTYTISGSTVRGQSGGNIVFQMTLQGGKFILAGSDFWDSSYKKYMPSGTVDFVLLFKMNM